MMTTPRWLFPDYQSTPGSVALLLLRVVGGAAIICHGYGKIQAPFTWMGPDAWAPGFLQALAAVSEFGGGIAWILGLLTVPASALFLGTMAVAVGTHLKHGDPFVGKGGSWELAALYFAIAVLFLLVGAGRFSVDHIISRRKSG